jgi:DNA-binding NarL/FixJ family response regulator
MDQDRLGGARRPINILLADDHDVVRRGLSELVAEEDEWNVCAEASDGWEAVELAKRHKPDVVVLDLTMPGLNGLEATRQIKKAVPTAEVLICTMHEDKQLARELFSAGARGYLLKSDSARSMVSAIRALIVRRPFISSRIAEPVPDCLQPLTASNSDNPVSPRLTERERQIVRLLAEGNSNKKISAILGISVKTVETHRTTVMRKLAVTSIVGVVRYAVQNSLIPR